MIGFAPLMSSARAAVAPTATAQRGRDDYRSPAPVLDVVRNAFGGRIDLDPCAAPAAEDQFAHWNYTGPTYGLDGLAEPWNTGTVYANVPYSKALTWIRKALAEYGNGSFERCILLLPARTDTRAWDELTSLASGVCFVRGRLTFAGERAAAPFPSVLVYLGPQAWRFERAAAQLGRIWIPADLAA